MKRATLENYATESAEYVVLHARLQRSRGRSPSATYCGFRNPRKALALAGRHAYFPRTGVYLSNADLSGYKCGKCGATGCKLWREYQTVSPKLLCAPCAATHEKKDISQMDANGCRPDGIVPGMRTDQIGWFVPAVPDEDGLGYWGYTSVPQAGCDWWRKLPTFPHS